jgi:hypothetical protein
MKQGNNIATTRKEQSPGSILDRDQRLFSFGGVWLSGLRGMLDGRVGIGEWRRTGEGGCVGYRFCPMFEFVLEAKLLLHQGDRGEQGLAEVGEVGGFAKGDAVLGDGDEEFAEDVVDVGGSEEIAVEGRGNFLAETLGLDALEFLPGVEGAEGWMGRAAEHAAAAVVGKLE